MSDEKEFTIVLPYPCTSNTMYRVYNYKRPTIGQKYKSFIAGCKNVLEQFLEKQLINTIDYRLEIHIVLYPPDKRLRDIDNNVKPILDVLQKFRIIKNDNLVDKLVITRKKPIFDGYAEVKLIEYKE